MLVVTRIMGINIAVAARRYFLRRLRRVKKANGQILSVNEVGCGAVCLALLMHQFCSCPGFAL